MTHHVSRQRWGVVDFDDATGQVFVQEDWVYRWQLSAGVHRRWTHLEQVATHRRLDRSIWGQWSNRFKFRVRAKNGPLPAFGAECPVNFDVRWALHTGHWTVTMLKMPPNANSTTHVSFVDWSTFSIELDTADFLEYESTNDAGARRTGIHAIPHEFGHTLFNLDEYKAGYAHLADSDSLMNVGRQLRARHLELIVHTLNRLMPNLVFSA